MNAGGIKRFTREELRAKREKGESRSELDAVRRMSEAELETSIAEDPDWKNVPRDWWKDALPVMPGPKKLLSLRLDPDVVDWFRAEGPGYQTRMNAVLRAYMQARTKRSA